MSSTDDSTAAAPPRRSSRLKRCASVAVPRNSSPEKRVTKKRRVLSKNFEQNGALKDVPIDILLEIFDYLYAVDLLNLARASKALRCVILDSSFAPVWRAVLANTPKLPPKPEEYDEIDYAERVFGDHCSFCASPEWRTMAWCLMVRFCDECLRQNFTEVDLTDYNTNVPVLRLREVRDLVPMIYVGSRLYILKKDLKTYNDEYKAVAKRPDALEKWGKVSYARRLGVIAFTDACAEARAAADAPHLEREKKMLEIRRWQIYECFRKTKWEREMQHAQVKLSRHPLVATAEELEDDDIPVIKDEIIRFLEQHKVDRRKKQRSDNLQTYGKFINAQWDMHISGLPPDAIYPPVCDFILSPQFQKVMEARYFRLHYELRDKIEVLAKEIGEKWKTAKDADLVGIMSKALKRTTTAEELQLATTFFECNPPDASSKAASEVISAIGYPRILITSHASRAPAQVHSEKNEIVRLLGKTPWNWKGERVVFDAAAHESAREVVSLCGLDPDTATAKDMEARGTWLECTGCCKRGSRRVMQWYQAVRHAQAADRWTRLCTSGKPALKVLSQEDALRAAAARDEQWHVPGTAKQDRRKRSATKAPLARVMCVHCKSTGDPEDVMEHLAKKHKIAQALPKDVVVSLDEPEMGEYIVKS
ncbi:hypothetical protein BD626DRAFT_569556 [Schizophyllum amplum]|uniref:F-box domain-containing protein n=1 Tax=Schizophyllum amplum TaxID=97359 RepID=A0A550CDX7_9AGAR|nr:hypothetical protein BD626DRAFT_569556 [Auriculariopsis ampla]